MIKNGCAGLKAETNPDINVKLVRGKCQSVGFSSTVGDYQSVVHSKCSEACCAGDQPEEDCRSDKYYIYSSAGDPIV